MLVLLQRTLKQQVKLLGEIGALKAAIDGDVEPAPIVRQEAAPPEEGLPIGALAPKFSLLAIEGHEVSLDELLGYGKSVLLLFVGPSCWGCKLLLPVVRIWQREYADQLTIAVLSKGSLKENQAKMAKYEISYLLDENSEVAGEYQARWTPAAVLIHPNGRIARPITYGDNAIRELTRELVASGDVPPGLSNGNGTNGHIPQVALRYSVREIGEPAPTFLLPDLSGKVVNMEDLLGSAILLLFWHPGCQFCQAMLGDLRRWEDNPPKDAPKLVIIASGEVEDIRTVNEDLKSLTLLDPAFDIGPLFGTKYAPSAILIDEEGRIASSLGMGDQNVRALLGLRRAELPETVQV